MSQNLALDLTKGQDINKAGGNILVSNGSNQSYVPEGTTIPAVGFAGGMPSTEDQVNAYRSYNGGKYVIIKPEGSYDSRTTLYSTSLGYFAADGNLTSVPIDANTSRVSGYGILMSVSGSGWQVATDPNFTASGSYTQNGVSHNKTVGWAVDPINKVYDAHYLVGNYYQWLAATAQTTDQGKTAATYTAVTSSICPKNWQLPKGYPSGSSNQYNGNFYLLLVQIAYGSLRANSTKPYGSGATYNIAWAPLFFTRAGYIHQAGSKMSGVGQTGYYWTGGTSKYIGTDAISVVLSGNSINNMYAVSRGEALSVRCLVISSE